MLSFLETEQLRLLVFCGKGGVGKTTIACATALELSRRVPDNTLLLVSTDPAHSLSDCLEQPIGGHIRPVDGFPNLSVLELDARSRLAAFRRRYHKELEALLERGTLLNEEETQELLQHSLSGLDEVAALLEVAAMLRSGRYDLILLDTAPTGHFLRFLELPHLMEGWIETASLMQGKYRYMVGRLTGRKIRDRVDEMLKQVSSDVKGIGSLFRNDQATGCILVTIPEPMAVEETKRLFEHLHQLHVPVRALVVNRVLSKGDCPLCHGRAAGQAKMRLEIEQLCVGTERLDVELFPCDVRGKEKLLELAGAIRRPRLDEREAFASAPFESGHGGPRPFGKGRGKRSDRSRVQGHLNGLANVELLLFGGKGGVGKTTMAAATAVALNQQDHKKTLLFSTDPAHSLSDCFSRAIGNRLTALSDDERLVALEIDSTQLFGELKGQFSEAVAEAFGSGDIELPFERAITEGLIQMTPPGIDELLALLKVVEFMHQGTFERYVLDLAPTGHALRFLESFDLLNAWRASASKLVVRYGIAANRPLAMLVQRLRHLRTVRDLLRDPTRCQFVAVAVPETMVVLELRRLLERLQALGICVHHLIVNRVVPPPLGDAPRSGGLPRWMAGQTPTGGGRLPRGGGIVLESGCPFCQATRHEQQQLLQQLQTLKRNLVHVPLFAHHPIGLELLHELADRLMPEKAKKEQKEVVAEDEPPCDLAQAGAQDRTGSRHGSWVSRMLHLRK